jgi:hypothetical protein
MSLEAQSSQFVPEAAGKLPQQIGGVDAQLGQESGMLVGVHLVRQLGLGLGCLVIVSLVPEELEDLGLVDLHGILLF